MAGFFKVRADSKSVADSTGGSYISKSGIYDVELTTVSVKTNEHGARSLNFNVAYKGGSQTFYGLKLDNNDGTANFQEPIFNKLCVIQGFTELSDPEIQTHKLGKAQTPTDLAVLADFDGLPVKIKIQMVYKLFEGSIKENAEIKAFYRAEDGASAQEIIDGTTPGLQYAKDLVTAEVATYKDGLTSEDVAAWIAAKKAGASASTPKAAVNTFAAPAAASAGFPG